jgi:hypothetical protein
LPNYFQFTLKSPIKIYDIKSEYFNDYTNIILYYNLINEYKYYLKYIDHYLSVIPELVYGPPPGPPPGSPPINYNNLAGIIGIPPGIGVIPNLDIYFEKRIQPNFLQSGNINYQNPNEYPIIIPAGAPNRIYAIEDIITNLSEYQNTAINDTNKFFKVFSQTELNTLNTLLLDDPNDNSVLDKINVNVNTNTIYINKYPNIGNYTVGKQPLEFLKKLIIKYLYRELIDPIDSTKSTIPKINRLLDDYNSAGIDKDKILSENILNYGKEVLDELLKYYKIYHAKVIIRNIIKTSLVKSEYILDDSLNIDISKLLGMDYFKNKTNTFKDESALAGNKYYYYNYLSNDEGLLCYKNNKDIISILLNTNTTQYMIRDQEKNTILHYLVNLENSKLFLEIFNNNKPKFDQMKKFENIHKKMPIRIIMDKINENNTNFYDVSNPKKLLYSNLYSDDLMIKLRNNNELQKNIPKYIENIFNDIYIIFNIDNINTDFFYTSYNTKNTYEEIYEDYANKSYKQFNDFKDQQIKIKPEMYKFLQNRNDLDNKYISNNEYYKRFYNTLVHIITLHVSSLFYTLVKDLLLSSNKGVLGFNEDTLNLLKIEIFEFNPTYKKLNLAQLIILNIYKVKYDEDIIENKSLSSLKEILKYKINIFNDIIVSSRDDEFRENIDKIYDYMNIFFDVFNKKIILFLTNYVKFIELQYNLQEIQNALT